MKRTWRKLVNAALCAVVITTSVSATALAYSPVATLSCTESPVVTSTLSAGEAVPYAEETTWCFRIHNGQPQKRLWSNTRGIWLTEWTDCGYLP